MFRSDSDVVGVDFSGASKAGRQIWITECREVGENVEVTDCYAVERETETPDRDTVLDRLVEAINGATSCTVGLDFPFGLPEEVVTGNSWEEVVDEVRRLDGPVALFETYRAKAESRGGQTFLNRKTESEEVGGQCPYGLRIRSQTYYGVSHVLHELDEERVAVRPMQEHDAEVEVVETYPAATFGGLEGASRKGYKQKRQESHDTRFENCEAMAAESNLRLPEGTKKYAECDDNALDSIAAALAASRADTVSEPQDRYKPVEGYIYV